MQEYWKYLATSKLFHPHEGHELVHAGALFAPLFLIGKLQDRTSLTLPIPS